MKIVLTGPKGAGKTTLGAKTARLLDIPFYETDEVIENIYANDKGEKLSCREIYIKEGESFFRNLEKLAVSEISQKDWCLVSTGGSTMINHESRSLLRKNSLVVLLKAPDELLWSRIKQGGIPPFLACENGYEIHCERNLRLYESAEHIADLVFEIDHERSGSLHHDLADEIMNLLMLNMHSSNTLGEIIRTTTFGESHGRALGAVLDGLSPGIEINEELIQKELDRRRPGQSRVTTPRNEKDRVEILSGVFEGKTTGTPVCMLVYNKDQDSSKYDALRDLFRPGHADFSFWKKYGIRDHRGGGRSSGRETIGRVAAGAVALDILKKRGIEITAYTESIAGIYGEKEDFSFIENNPVRSADPEKASLMEKAVLAAREEHDSVGGTVKLVIKNTPEGAGDPVFFKLDARLAMAFFSVGAVKGVEIGAGFKAAEMKGSENNDEMQGNKFLANNAGGIIGGISTGQDIVVRIAVKPTPSILKEQKTVDIHGNDQTVSVEGRHDPCIVPRIIPVIEAMAALVLLDALEINDRIGRA